MKEFGIILMTLCIMCSAFAQDTLQSFNNIDTISIDCSSAILRSWHKAYPFKHIGEKQETNIDKEADVANLHSVDSLLALVETMTFDNKLYSGQIDYRLPKFVTSEFPTNKQKTLADKANELANNDWAYIEPAVARFQEMEEINNLRQLQIFEYVKVHPSRYDFPSNGIELPPSLSEEEVSTAKSLEGKSLELGDGVMTFTKIGEIQSQIKTDRWHHVGSSLLQMTQTALTDNWYKGGDNNMTVSTVQKLSLSTYDENKKSSFDILLELRLSSLYAKADTVHPLRVNDNLFSANIKYGYQAWKRWYYSSALYAKTPIFDYYNTNSKVTKSSFLAPLETNLSAGMEYKYISKDKSLTYSLLLAPLAYNMKYVMTDRVNETSFGIDEGKSSVHKFGSTVSSTLTWKITNDIAWSSRLYCFTSYDNIQVEFENTFSFNLNRRFTCQIYLYPRFDDSFDDKIQMKEMLTFGLNYNW